MCNRTQQLCVDGSRSTVISLKSHATHRSLVAALKPRQECWQAEEVASGEAVLTNGPVHTGISMYFNLPISCCPRQMGAVRDTPTRHPLSLPFTCGLDQSTARDCGKRPPPPKLSPSIVLARPSPAQTGGISSLLCP